MIEKELQYHRPYDKKRLQNAPLRGATMIGSPKERYQYSNNLHLNTLNKLNSQKTPEEENDHRAKETIRRLCEHLKLSRNFCSHIFHEYKMIRKKILAGTKYRNPEKLVPIVMYLYAKTHCISVRKKELIEFSIISKKEFNYFLLHANLIIPGYAARDRLKFIKLKIMEVTNAFSMNMGFYHDAVAVLENIIPLFPGAKETIQAALACSITLLNSCYPNKKNITLNSICLASGIVFSTVETRIKKDIIDKYGVKGYRGVVTSREILIEQLKKLKVI